MSAPALAIAGLGLLVLALAAWLVAAHLGFAARLREARRDAVARSQAVTTGKVTEQLVPFLPGFGFNPRDARFLGSPVDLVVFDGLDAGAVRRVVLVEVKTGAADLSGRERQVRDAVRAGRVEWLELRLPGPGPAAD